MTCYHCWTKDNLTFHKEIRRPDGTRVHLYLCNSCHNYIEDFPDEPGDREQDAERQRQCEIERKQAIQKEIDDERMRRWNQRQEDKRWEKEYDDELNRYWK